MHCKAEAVQHVTLNLANFNSVIWILDCTKFQVFLILKVTEHPSRFRYLDLRLTISMKSYGVVLALLVYFCEVCIVFINYPELLIGLHHHFHALNYYIARILLELLLDEGAVLLLKLLN